jgi:hypothetical protein
MDNRINEICRKISALRLEMADLEAVVRDLVNRDLDCAGSALRQIGLRQDMTRLIGEWRLAGGGDLLPNVGERMGLRPAKKDGRPVHAAARR